MAFLNSLLVLRPINSEYVSDNLFSAQKACIESINNI